jgi:hypothetical protein
MNKSMKNKILIMAGIAGSLFFTGVAVCSAQDGVQTRSITSDDFASQRPQNADLSNQKKAVPKPRPFRYKYVRTYKNPVRAKRPEKVVASNAPQKMTEIGVTMWKLREPRPSEKNAFLLPVLDDNQERKMWLAERVPIDTVFQPGDRVRFAIESSDSGYLYVFGRETYSDGSFGAPYPIFSGSETSQNAVRPGMLFDIPDQREDLPYLKIDPKKANYTGELLTIIVSPKASADLALDKDNALKDGSKLAELEFNSEVEIFSRTDSVDRIFSKAEAEATCGVKTRELVRDTPSADPSGTRSRQLSRQEALPQTIFRVKGVSGRPAVAFIKLAVQN